MGRKLGEEKRINQIICHGKADIFLIQESKISRVNVTIVSSMWSKENMGGSYSKSAGQFGGLITL